MTTAERRARFRDLHAGNRLFVMPNPWDVGSARLLEAAGFEALATTSAGYAWSLGRRIRPSRARSSWRTPARCPRRRRCRSTSTASVLSGRPGGVAETVRLLAGAGVAGCSVEDWDPADRSDRRRRRRGRAGGRGRRGRARPARSRWCSRHAPRTTFTASTTSTTRSAPARLRRCRRRLPLRARSA